jgi:hypothetical protein
MIQLGDDERSNDPVRIIVSALLVMGLADKEP